LYVDDIITALKISDIDKVLSILNSYNTNIQFTAEVENGLRLNFLDMTIHKVDNKLITNWYKKETSSNRILNFLSADPYHFKFNIAQSFARRVIDLSYPKFHQNNFKIIQDILIQNNYPYNIVKKAINKIKFQFQNNNNNNSKQISNSNNNLPDPSIPQISLPNKSYCSINYIPKLSENIVK